MALSGSFNTTAYSGRYLTLSWTATQSVANNTSTISWTLRGAGGGSGYYKAGNFKVIIAGETVYSSSARIDLYSGTVVASGTKTIAHNTDGSKSFSASAEAGIYAVAVNCSGSGSFTLDKIPRAATITSAPNFKDTDSPTVAYSSPAGSAVSAIELCISADGTDIDIPYRAVSKTGTSYKFTFTDAEKAKLWGLVSSGTTASVYFMLRTTIGGVYYYNKVRKTLTLVDATPIVEYEIIDVGSSSTKLTGDPNIIISGFNVVSATITATFRKGATVKQVYVKNGDKWDSAKENVFTKKFSYTTNNTFIFTAQDSRGNQATTGTITKSFVSWFKPTCNLATAAPTTAGALNFDISGKWFSGSFGAVTNTLAVQFRIKENNGDYSEWQDVTAIFDGNEYSAAVALEGLHYQNSYTVQARAIDEVGKLEDKYIALTNERTVKTTPVYDWGENDFSVNVPMYLQGSPVADFVIDQGTSGIWQYRLWRSGKAECWGYLSHNTAVNTAWGSMYVGSSKMSRQSYPFSFVSKPTEVVSVQSGNSAVWVFAESGSNGSNSATQTGIYNVCRPTNVTASSNYHFSFYVIGKWK